MRNVLAVAERFYDAVAQTDGQALFDLLTDDFVGVVSAGMPHGLGGQHLGPSDMINGVWAPVSSIYDIRVEPDEFLVVDDDRVVVLGHYRGRAWDGNSAVDAAFAHVITVRGEHLAALQQITDTRRWEMTPST